MTEKIDIPYDIYESPTEVVIVMPLWWVKKESLELKVEDYRLVIHWVREKLELREDFIPLKEECYRWDINLVIDLPPQSYFDRIHSKLTADSILQVVIPKAIVPDHIDLEIEYND